MSSIWPARSRSIPAQAIIAALSVQSRGGGATKRAPWASAMSRSAVRIAVFAATPPATAKRGQPGLDQRARAPSRPGCRAPRPGTRPRGRTGLPRAVRLAGPSAGRGRAEPPSSAPKSSCRSRAGRAAGAASRSPPGRRPPPPPRSPARPAAAGREAARPCRTPRPARRRSSRRCWRTRSCASTARNWQCPPETSSRQVGKREPIGQPRRQRVARQVVDADQRQPGRRGQPLGAHHARQHAADQARAGRHRDTVESGAGPGRRPRAPASTHRSSRSAWARAAISGTTPP